MYSQVQALIPIHGITTDFVVIFYHNLNKITVNNEELVLVKCISFSLITPKHYFVINTQIKELLLV